MSQPPGRVKRAWNKKNSNNIFSLLSSLVIFQITIALFTIYALGVSLARDVSDDGDDGVSWELKKKKTKK